MLPALTTISNCEADQVDFVVFVVHNLLRKRRTVDTSVRLPGDVERIFGKFWETFEKCFQDAVVVDRCRSVAVGAVVVVAVRETDACMLQGVAFS